MTQQDSDGMDEGSRSSYNPFAGIENEQEAAVMGAQGWIVTSTKKREYDVKFHSLHLAGGKASGSQVMNVMVQSDLSRDTLRKIWELADIDTDGKMDHEEFALCLHLIEHVK